MNILTKRGSQDNVVTYEHICDTIEDRQNIENKYITLGTVCIVLNGENGGMEVYMADSSKEWHDIMITGSDGESSASGLSIYVCAQNEVQNGKPAVSIPIEGTLYLVPSGNQSGNLYDEYIYVNDAWEQFGSAGIDLTGYATQTWVQQQNYLTSHQDISGKANSADLATVATSGSYNDLSNKPTIPNVPVESGQEIGSIQAKEVTISNVTYAQKAQGQGSVAFGLNTTAYGAHSTAFGKNNFVACDGGFASGENSYAGGDGSAYIEGSGGFLTATITGNPAANKYLLADVNMENIYPGMPILYENNGVERRAQVNSVNVEEGSITAFSTVGNGLGNLTSGTIKFYKHASCGFDSHAEGFNTLATGAESHAEGIESKATSIAAHAEGLRTKSTNLNAHSEGNETVASGESSHAEGCDTKATGNSSHAEGEGTRVSAPVAHAEGLFTEASGNYQHVQGKYNIIDANSTYAHIVGNGTSSTRSNAHTLDWDGNAWYAGSVKAGTQQNPAAVTYANDLVTKQYFDNNAATFPSNPATGSFLVYNGSAWVAQTLQTWQGGNY